MLIAIATNDRKTIAKRTGRAKEFAFFTIENNKIIDVHYEDNDHDHHHHHDRSEGNHRQGRGNGQGQGRHQHHHEEDDHDHEYGEHSHDEVVEQLKDIDMFLVRAVGKHMRGDLEKGNIPFKIVTKEDDIVKIVENYVSKL